MTPQISPRREGVFHRVGGGRSGLQCLPDLRSRRLRPVRVKKAVKVRKGVITSKDVTVCGGVLVCKRMTVHKM